MKFHDALHLIPQMYVRFMFGMVPFTDLDMDESTAGMRASAMGVLDFLAQAAERGSETNFVGRPVADLPNLRLVFFRANSEGMADTVVEEVRKIPMYFTDVVPFALPSDEDIAMRRRIATSHGFLPIWPDEAFLVRHRSPSTGHTFVSAFSCNDQGSVEELRDFYYLDTVPEAFETQLRPQQIGALHVIAAKSTLVKTTSQILTNFSTLTPLEMERLKKTAQLLEQHIPNAPPKTTRNGAIVSEIFFESGSVNSMKHFTAGQAGWIHYPTSQDAWYYGVAVNPVNLQVVVYAEGDLTRFECATKDCFMQELADLAAFHGRAINPSWIGFSCGEENQVSLGFPTLSFLDVGETLTAPATVVIDHESHRNSQAGVMVDLSRAFIDRLKSDEERVGTRIQLQDGVDFQFSLLDARSFAKRRAVRFTKLAEAFWAVNLQLDEQEYSMTYSLQVETSS